MAKRRRVFTWLTVSGLLVASVAAAVGALRAADHEAPSEAAAQAVGFPPRERPVLVPLDDGRIFAYGGRPQDEDQGEAPLNDAAIISPTTGATEVLTSPPFDVGLSVPAMAVLADDSVVLLGSLCSEFLADDPAGGCDPGTYAAAAYSLQTSEWRRVAIPEDLVDVRNGSRLSVGVDPGGNALFILGPPAQQGLPIAELWRLEISRDSWERIESPEGIFLSACVSGDSLVTSSSPYLESEAPGLGSEAPGNAEQEAASAPFLRIYRLDGEGGGWRQTDQAPVDPYLITEPRTVCLDNFAVVHDGSGHGLAAYPLHTDTEPPAGWVAPATPIPAGIYLQVVAAGDQVVLLDSSPSNALGHGPSLVYDPAQASWREISAPSVPIQGTVWNGSALVGWPEAGGSAPVIVELEA
jgi:hypothetical protein